MGGQCGAGAFNKSASLSRRGVPGGGRGSEEQHRECARRLPSPCLAPSFAETSRRAPRRNDFPARSPPADGVCCSRNFRSSPLAHLLVIIAPPVARALCVRSLRMRRRKEEKITRRSLRYNPPRFSIYVAFIDPLLRHSVT